jgi:hypothetical protein
MSRSLVALVCALALVAPACAQEARVPVLKLATPVSPPNWALLQREVLRTSSEACRAFYDKYFDERGWLLCVERWGGDDGPDDAIENCNDWPLLHALGGTDEVRKLYLKAWEGHLRQYTLAKTKDVPFARDGMYYKEFPVMFDWLHHAEGLTVFQMQGLSYPRDDKFHARARRFAGFYLNEDPGAPNYDPKHKIIKSLFNGSRGPLLRKATALDWAGDPIEIKNRFVLGHGETSYDEMLAHFKDYTDIVGDHPQNLSATALALTAFAATGEAKYKDWALEYTGAWRQRTIDNNGVIPTNVGLDGKIGSAAGGKWYGGTYGWGFSVEVPQTKQLAHRNTHYLGLTGFGVAYLFTGDDRWIDPWRKMIDHINGQAKKGPTGAPTYPHMYGDKGWYDFKDAKYTHGAEEIWYWSMADADRARLPNGGWVAFLEGKNPNYPEQCFRADLDTVRKRAAGMRADKTTPDTRLADDPMKFNPAPVANLVRLATGGLHHGNRTLVMHSRVRYFDPAARRPGLPPDVAALVEGMTANETVLNVVNVSPLHARRVIVQAGAYGEHRFTTASADGAKVEVNGTRLELVLEPGAGARLVLGTKRYANPPTFELPW